jgi:hypothetical protein
MMASKCESAGDLGFDATFTMLLFCQSVRLLIESNDCSLRREEEYGRNTMKQEPKPSNSDHVSIN